MDISVTDFKQRCLDIIRRVERTGRPVTITRRGRVVARLDAATTTPLRAAAKPWERLRGSAACSFEARESMLHEEDFEVSR